MATFTDNFALAKPTYGELADVAVINGNMDTIDGIMHSNRTMLAPAFSQTEDYAVGDVVVYEGNLYRFIVPHTAGNWDGTEVEQTTLGEEVSTKGGADVTKTASGNPIEITDGASAPLVKCVTEIQGSQDLHGYDKPWVGGAGKNKLPMTVDSIKSFNTSAMGYTWVGNSCSIFGVTYTLLTDDGDNVIGIKATSNGAASGMATLYVYGSNTSTPSNISISNDMLCTMGLSGSESTFRGIVWKESGGQFIDGGTVAINANDTLYGFGIRVVSGYTVPSGGIIFLPMIRADETSPAYEPYSNICPISGYSSVGVGVVGKNQLENTASTTTINGVTFTVNADGTVSASGTASGNANLRVYSISNPTNAQIDFFASKILNGCPANGSNSTYYIFLQSTGNIGRDTGDGFDIPSDLSSYYGASEIYVSISVRSGYTANNLLFKPMLRLATETDPTYEPYAGRTYTIALGDTYYSGQIDAVRGVLVATHGYDEFDGTANVTISRSRYSNWYYTIANGGYAGANTSDVLSNKYEGASVTDNTDVLGIRKQASGTVRVRVGGTEPADVSGFVAELTDTHLQVVYPLATPIEIPLTPTVISSLLGNNTIWTDGDNLEVEYITEEFQPIVDLIQSNGGKHEYSTNEQVVGTWTDGRKVYERVLTGTMGNNSQIIIDLATELGCDMVVDIKGWIVATDSTNQIWMHDSYVRFFLQGVSNLILNKNDAGNYGYDNPYTFIIRYVKPSSNTRSLNLTKSAVTENDSKDEIPEEIKNAPFEEKPDYNEADDDAPTEVDER